MIIKGTVLAKNKTYEFSMALYKMNMERLKKNQKEWLHPEEAYFLKSLNYPLRQHSYLLGRFVAKQAIARHLGLDTQKDIFIDHGIFGQPIIKSHSFVGLTLSHSKDYGTAICYPFDCPLAVDIEVISPDATKIIKPVLTEWEQKFLHSARGYKEHEFATLMWTAKEALSKLLWGGFLINYESFKIKNIVEKNGYFYTEFLNFSHLKATSVIRKNYVISIISSRDVNF